MLFLKIGIFATWVVAAALSGILILGRLLNTQPARICKNPRCGKFLAVKQKKFCGPKCRDFMRSIRKVSAAHIGNMRSAKTNSGHILDARTAEELFRDL